ncbi:MAG TPA: hypothetical protein VFG99_11985, partial [Chloroflexia bacterium]|nr:hypothetical protein [Chloroflexia bacterium]
MLALQSGSRNDAFAEPVATGGVGYQGPYFGNIGEPTARDPQSKLWFNDGLWWASMYNRTAGRFEIHRLDSATQDWSATGTAIDSRT